MVFVFGGPMLAGRFKLATAAIIKALPVVKTRHPHNYPPDYIVRFVSEALIDEIIRKEYWHKKNTRKC